MVNPLGGKTKNPILDTREYEVEFADGEVQEYSAHVIAQNLYSSVEYDGKRFVIMVQIVDHKSDASATTKEQAFVAINGKRVWRMTTKEWKQCVQ